MSGRKMFIAIIAVCGAAATTSLQRSIWMLSQIQECWDHDVNCFSENDFI